MDRGRTGNSEAVKEHIIRRARAVAAPDKLPADWGASCKTPATNTTKK
jgi:hypothetical protein